MQRVGRLPSLLPSWTSGTFSLAKEVSVSMAPGLISPVQTLQVVVTVQGARTSFRAFPPEATGGSVQKDLTFCGLLEKTRTLVKQLVGKRKAAVCFIQTTLWCRDWDNSSLGNTINIY